ELEVDRFHRKIAAGARFAMTQILFDMEFLDRFFARFGGSSPIPLLVGVWPIRSLELAVRVHNETPGIVVPEHVQERYRRAGPNAPQVGARSEEHTSELQSPYDLVCRLLLEKKKSHVRYCQRRSQSFN